MCHTDSAYFTHVQLIRLHNFETTRLATATRLDLEIVVHNQESHTCMCDQGDRAQPVESSHDYSLLFLGVKN